MGEVKLTYLGSSDRLIDPATGLTWSVGESHSVSIEDAERLVALKHEQWDVLTDNDERAAAEAAEAERAAAREAFFGAALDNEESE